MALCCNAIRKRWSTEATHLGCTYLLLCFSVLYKLGCAKNATAFFFEIPSLLEYCWLLVELDAVVVDLHAASRYSASRQDRGISAPVEYSTALSRTPVVALVALPKPVRQAPLPVPYVITNSSLTRAASPDISLPSRELRLLTNDESPQADATVVSDLPTIKTTLNFSHYLGTYLSTQPN